MLPLPRFPTHRPQQVLLLTNEDYQGGNMWDYPARVGYGPRTVAEWKLLFCQPARLELEAFLQNWLFLGTIQTLIDPNIGLKQLRRYDNSLCHYVVDTSALVGPEPSIFRGYGILTSGIDVNGCIKTVCRAAVNLEKGRAVGIYANDWKSSPVDLMTFLMAGVVADPRHHTHVFVSKITLELLGSIWIDGANRERAATSQQAPTVVPVGDMGPFLNKRMRNDGWCPADLFSLSLRIMNSGCYFVSHISRRQKSGQDLTIVERHELCGEATCFARQVNLEHYRRVHAIGCLGCKDISVPIDRLQYCLSRNKVPVVKIDDEDTRPAEELEVVAVDSKLKYVAISHVWSDGLGNPEANAIPLCQYRSLSRRVRSIPGDRCSYLWLDTLCVPQGKSPAAQTARHTAITLMLKTYQNATVVLVLDSWLMSHTIREEDSAEALSMISCCAWTSRLWTYQEGIVARKLLFQFANMAYDVISGLKRLKSSPDARARRFLLEPLRKRVIEMTHEVQGLTSKAKLLNIMTTMKYRSTSRLADEALCLGNLFGFDIRNILAVEDAESRMAIFWRSFKEVPLEIMRSRFPRLTVAGLQWAPKSLLQTAGLSIQPYVQRDDPGWDLVGTLKADGLHATTWGFVFDFEPTMGLKQNFLVGDSTGLFIDVKMHHFEHEEHDHGSDVMYRAETSEAYALAFVSVEAAVSPEARRSHLRRLGAGTEDLKSISPEAGFLAVLSKDSRMLLEEKSTGKSKGKGDPNFKPLTPPISVKYLCQAIIRYEINDAESRRMATMMNLMSSSSSSSSSALSAKVMAPAENGRRTLRMAPCLAAAQPGYHAWCLV